MRISKKRLERLIDSWNPEMVIYIRYTSKNSRGKMTMSIAFFLEFYQKINKLFKGCKIREIFVKNENTQIVLYEGNSLPDLWFYAIGRKYNG